MIDDRLTILFLRIIFFITISFQLFIYILWKRGFKVRILKYLGFGSTVSAISVYISSFSLFSITENKFLTLLSLLSLLSILLIFISLTLVILMMASLNHSGVSSEPKIKIKAEKENEKTNEDMKKFIDELKSNNKNKIAENDFGHPIVKSNVMSEDNSNSKRDSELEKFELEELYLGIKDKKIEDDQISDPKARFQKIIDDLFNKQNRLDD